MYLDIYMDIQIYIDISPSIYIYIHENFLSRRNLWVDICSLCFITYFKTLSLWW